MQEQERELENQAEWHQHLSYAVVLLTATLDLYLLIEIIVDDRREKIAAMKTTLFIFFLFLRQKAEYIMSEPSEILVIWTTKAKKIHILIQEHSEKNDVVYLW